MTQHPGGYLGQILGGKKWKFFFNCLSNSCILENYRRSNLRSHPMHFVHWPSLSWLVDFLTLLVPRSTNKGRVPLKLLLLLLLFLGMHGMHRDANKNLQITYPILISPTTWHNFDKANYMALWQLTKFFFFKIHEIDSSLNVKHLWPLT